MGRARSAVRPERYEEGGLAALGQRRGYLRDGRFLIDNNLVENDVRPAAVGRRRWLFIGHPDAGWRSAVIYTIIQSCRRRGINTQEYLIDVLRRLPAMKSSEVVNLVPSRWKPQPPPT